MSRRRRKLRSFLTWMVSAVVVAVAWYRGGANLEDFWKKGGGRAPSRSWERLEGCRYVSHEGNDGDSFHVMHGGREFIFRLYFVDAPETEASFPERVDEQAQYFEMDRAQVLALGKSAAAFTRKQLHGRTFTVWTRWRDALGRSRLPRHYALVRIGARDLGEMLVENGLARIYGTRVELPSGRDSRSYLRDLNKLEAAARQRRAGGWRETRRAAVLPSRPDSFPLFIGPIHPYGMRPQPAHPRPAASLLCANITTCSA